MTNGFVTVEAADRSLLRGDEIGEDHEEDADDEADVEVDERLLHALSGLLLAETHFHPSFCLLLVSKDVV